MSISDTDELIGVVLVVAFSFVMLAFELALATMVSKALW